MLTHRSHPRADLLCGDDCFFPCRLFGRLLQHGLMFEERPACLGGDAGKRSSLSGKITINSLIFTVIWQYCNCKFTGSLERIRANTHTSAMYTREYFNQWAKNCVLVTDKVNDRRTLSTWIQLEVKAHLAEEQQQQQQLKKKKEKKIPLWSPDSDVEWYRNQFGESW